METDSQRNSAKTKRRKLLINMSLQGSLMRRVVVHWCIFACSLVVCLSLFHALEWIADPHTTSWDGFLRDHMLTFLLLFALIPPFIYDTIKLSNRWAGPMYRLKRYMDELADGKDVDAFRVRDGDFFSELGDSFNRIRERVASDKVAAQEELAAAREESQSPVG